MINDTGHSHKELPTQAILFDLDGTLLDSAMGLAQAANLMRQTRGFFPLAVDVYRPFISQGAKSLVWCALAGIKPELSSADQVSEALRQEFFDHYDHTYQEYELFPGIEDLIIQIRHRHCPWGIVTNKIERFTKPLIASCPLLSRAQVVISGDTTAYPKPHPEPLLEAARRLGVPPEACTYIGDDERDILAGQAAGMRTIVAAYGYLSHSKEPGGSDLTSRACDWQLLADARALDPSALSVCLGLS